MQLLLVLSILLMASFTDIRKREISNYFWLSSVVVVAPFVIFNLYVFEVWYRFLWLVSILSTFLLSYTLYKLKFFGGSDSKCLLFLSFSFPYLVGFTAPFFLDCKYYLTLKAVLPLPILVLIFSVVFGMVYRILRKVTNYPAIPFITVAFILLVLVG